MFKRLIQLESMSEPEHIGEILKRVFADLEKTYGGAVPRDLAESPDHPDPPREGHLEIAGRTEANASD